MFKQWGVAIRIGIISGILIFIALTAISWIVSQKIYTSIKDESIQDIQNQISSVKSLLDTYDTTAKDNTLQMASLFYSMVGNNITLDTTQTSQVGSYTLPILRVNTLPLNLNFSLVDRFSSFTQGAVATIFLYHDKEFVRIATSLTKEDGTRSVGTTLSPSHPGYQNLISGKPYTGLATLFGRTYMTHYQPIFQNKQLIAVLFVGTDVKTSLNALKQKISSIRIAKNGYIYIINAKEGETRGEFLVHPHYAGQNFLTYHDTEGKPFIQEMIKNKQGHISYTWEIPFIKKAEKKFVVYDYYAPWQWIIAGGCDYNELETNATTIRNLILILGIAIALTLGLVIFLLIRHTLQPLQNIQQGLLSFFDFLNRKTQTAPLIEIHSHDEFGRIASEINSNIIAIEKGIHNDAQAVKEAIDVAQNIKSGILKGTIHHQADNHELALLCHTLNQIVNLLNQHIGENLNDIGHLLNDYAEGNYHARIIKPHGKLEFSINQLGATISYQIEEITSKDQALIQQSRFAAMGEMIGNIAHQWRQPLNAVAAIIQDLQDAYRHNELSSELMDESIHDGMQLIEFMSRTINDFRQFFAPDQSPEIFSLTEICDKTLSFLDAALRNDIITIHKHYPYDTIKLLGYPNQLSQVILNLLSNAKDALKKNRTDSRIIQLKIVPDDQGVFLHIEDNGGGIPEDVLPKIFEPYFTTKEQGEGTGIGLYMSKNIVERYFKGRINVHNTREGVVFIIFIPHTVVNLALT